MGLFNRDTRSLAEIKRDNARMRNEGALRVDMNRYEDERVKASRENFGLKHEKKIRYVKKAGAGISWVGRGVGAGITALGNQYAKAEASKRPQKRKRRVKKVKKRKKKQNSFTITYN